MMRSFRPSSASISRVPGSQRFRAVRRRLAFESLEGRTLLTTGSSGLGIGVVLGNINNANTEYVWANVLEQAASTWAVCSPIYGAYGLASLPAGVAMPAMDSNGYPIGLGGLSAQGYSL